MSDSDSRLGVPCDRRRLLLGASLVGLGVVPTASLWGDWQPDRHEVSEVPLPGPMPEGAGTEELQMFRVLEGRHWGSRLERVELDLLMPGGRVLAWTWSREFEDSPSIQMPTPRGTGLEVTATLTDGRRHCHRAAIDRHTGILALEMTLGRPPLWRLEPDQGQGRRGLTFAFLLELTPISLAMESQDNV